MKVNAFRIRIPLALSAACIVLCLLAPVAAAQDDSREAGARDGSSAASHAQADAFLAQASAAMGSGDFVRASSLAGSALQLSPSYSEALYVTAQLEARDRDSTRAAIDHVRAALGNSSWSATDPSAAEQLLADLLTQTGQAAEARRTAERLTSRRPEDPRNFLLLARALDKAGASGAELRVLADALLRFPEDDALRLQDARLMARLGRSAEAASLVRTGLKVHPDSLPLLLSSAGLEIARAGRKSAADLYLSRGGTDPLGAVLGMESAALGQRGPYLESFLSLGGLSRQDLVSRVRDAVKGSPDLAAALARALEGYTGNRDLDSDGDGHWDERWSFVDGRPTGWVRDSAQDGVPPYEAEFRDGAPVSLSARTASGAVTRLHYSRYPALDRVDLPGEGTWFVVPYTLQCAFLRNASLPSDGSAPRIASRFSLPSVDAVRRASSRQEEYAADGTTLVRRVDLDQGRRVFMEESLAGDGTIDHRVWYQDGVPVRGTRSLSPGGRFEVTETWKGGRLAADAIDTDGDGKADYRESFGAAPVRSWDFNGDGRDDSREYTLPDGRHLRELSTRLDGTFDVRVVTQGARIVSVTRGGRAVPVQADTARGVTWIGEPARAPGRPDLAEADRIQHISGMPYLVFSTGGVIYAEALSE